MRCIRRRASECPLFEELDVPVVETLDPPSFMAWVDAKPTQPARRSPPASQREGPLHKFATWKFQRLPAEHLKSGVVNFGRAGDRVRKEKAQGRCGADGTPSLNLLKAIVHTDALPTALASRADHYWLTGPRRYMTVLEVCRAFGLSDGSPLTAALRRVRCPTNAVSMAGRGIHAGVAAAVLRWLDARTLLPAHPTYASSCSGVDFFAAALHERGSFAYMHAAECDKQCRAVLMDAWGLAAARIHEDAASAAARTAAHVDLYVASPSCVDFSARRHGRDDAVVAEGALDANSTVGFILDGRARVVVVEKNVAERDGVAAITTILARAPYDWRFAELDPRLHAGHPIVRERAYWVGVRRS